jgi:hypothetical protein
MLFKPPNPVLQTKAQKRWKATKVLKGVAQLLCERTATSASSTVRPVTRSYAASERVYPTAQVNLTWTLPVRVDGLSSIPRTRMRVDGLQRKLIVLLQVNIIDQCVD